METKILKIDRNKINESDFEEAGKLLRNGELVAFPTETVYGLGGNAMDAEASRKIYAAKGRPSDNPLIVHISKIEDLEEIATDIPQTAYALADKFWPGPMTLILKKKECVPKSTTGGLDTVAVRMPSDEIARTLIAVSKVFVAAPSANLSGRPSPTKASHVIEDMSGRIPMIIDGGSCSIGLESSIIDLTTEVPTILRPGFITYADFKQVLEDTEKDFLSRDVQKTEVKVAKAPGMKYKHYAPKGELTIVEGEPEKVVAYINSKIEEQKNSDSKNIDESGKNIKVAVLATTENHSLYNTDLIYDVGSRADEESIARELFAALRQFDDWEVPVIFSESFNDNKLSNAIMNRLLKAAGGKIVTV
ncbi:MAG: threonylcarbamoyl-AMP synthase [Lachnospiraceae bacterium]|nr:threonylcarbamoyl-AMP synthase [Lachnospiraceae bacterium]